METPQILKCPDCGSSKIFNNGKRYLSYGLELQRFKCRECGKRFSEHGTSLNRVPDNLGNSQISAKAKNLVTTQTLESVCAGDSNLLTYAWKSKVKHGNAENTIKLRVSTLNLIKKKGCDLNRPESIEIVLATEPLTKAQKYQWTACYRSFCKTMMIPWDAPKAKYEPKQPFMPTEAELDALIFAANKELATFLQVAKTTGARAGEISAILWTDINTDKNTIAINEAEKGSRTRTIPVPLKTIIMVNALPKKYDLNVFNPKSETARSNLCNLKKKLAVIHQNPRFKQIHLHTFRHYFATEKLRQTKMLSHVQYLLGHKSIMNTEKYTHLVDYSGEKYFSAVGTTREEKQALIEEGFEFVSSDPDGTQYFRKPK
jgi:integrase/recombinase XerD